MVFGRVRERVRLRHDAAGDAAPPHRLRRRVPRADRHPATLGRPRSRLELPRRLQVRLPLTWSATRRRLCCGAQYQTARTDTAVLIAMQFGLSGCGYAHELQPDPHFVINVYNFQCLHASIDACVKYQFWALKCADAEARSG